MTITTRRASVSNEGNPVILGGPSGGCVRYADFFAKMHEGSGNIINNLAKGTFTTAAGLCDWDAEPGAATFSAVTTPFFAPLENVQANHDFVMIAVFKVIDGTNFRFDFGSPGPGAGCRFVSSTGVFRYDNGTQDSNTISISPLTDGDIGALYFHVDSSATTFSAGWVSTTTANTEHATPDTSTLTGGAAMSTGDFLEWEYGSCYSIFQLEYAEPGPTLATVKAAALEMATQHTSAEAIADPTLRVSSYLL